jgi:hypothetical protein
MPRFPIAPPDSLERRPLGLHQPPRPELLARRALLCSELPDLVVVGSDAEEPGFLRDLLLLPGGEVLALVHMVSQVSLTVNQMVR